LPREKLTVVSSDMSVLRAATLVVITELRRQRNIANKMIAYYERKQSALDLQKPEQS